MTISHKAKSKLRYPSSGIVHHGVTKMFEGLKARDGNKVTGIDRY